MLKKQIQFFVWLGLVVPMAIGIMFSLEGCGDEPNPCEALKPMEAKFTIREKLLNDLPTDTLQADTTITGNVVAFEASEDYDNYEWKIGLDPKTFTTKKVSLLFLYPEDKIAVRLIAKKKSLKNCFPKDDGIDTLVKYFAVIDKAVNPVYGSYSGYLIANPSDRFEITVTHDQWFDQVNILNLNKGCNPVDESIGIRGFQCFVGFKKISFYGGYVNQCKRPIGWFYLAKNGKDVSIPFDEGNGAPNQVPPVNETKRIKYEFIGRKK